MSFLLTEGPQAGAALAALVAFIVAVSTTPMVRSTARRMGAVAAPKGDRWHRQPTAMLGGIAIYLSVILAMVLAVPLRREIWYVAGTSTILFAVGLFDDFFHVKPYQKLVGQLVGSLILIQGGLVLSWTPSAMVNMGLTLLWLIGITNSVNMLDNMDGLSAGVAGIAAIFLAINFYGNHQNSEAILLAAFAAALAGFLVYNRHPASIFMGDCGSMFIGFFLAGTALLSGTGGGRSRSVAAVVAVPVLVLFIPIFDTTFVTLMRKLAGRSASQGGRDHTSHRLVALGLSEKHAVWMLYLLAIGAGTLALFVRRVALDVSVVAIGSFTVALTFLGIHLGGVRVYDDEELAAAREKPLVSFLLDLSHKRRIFEVLLDVALMTISYYLAYALKFGPFNSASSDWRLFFLTLPTVVSVKAAVFLISGVYRGVWRYAGLSDAIALTRAVLLGSIAAIVAVVLFFRFDGFSRTVFAIDGLLLLLLIEASRHAFRLIPSLFPLPSARDGRRVLVYGAGDGGDLLLREIRNNSVLRYHAVGFVDDDPSLRGRMIQGLRVHSGSEGLASLCRRLEVTEVLVSTSKITGERLTLLLAECSRAGIGVTQAGITFERLGIGGRGETAGVPLIVDANDLMQVSGRTTTTDH